MTDRPPDTKNHNEKKTTKLDELDENRQNPDFGRFLQFSINQTFEFQFSSQQGNGNIFRNRRNPLEIFLDFLLPENQEIAILNQTAVAPHPTKGSKMFDMIQLCPEDYFDDKSNEFIEGFDAFLDNYNVTTVPYIRGTVERMQWIRGWKAAKKIQIDT